MKKAFMKLTALFIAVVILTSVCMFSSVAAENVKATDLQKPSGNIVIVPSDKIPDFQPGKVVQITYECCDSCGYSDTYNYGEGKDIEARYSGYCSDGKNAFVCWVDENGKEYYRGDLLPFATMTLKAKKIPLLLGSEEVLSFSNADRNYHTDEFDGYYMDDADYRMMQRNITRVFGFGTFPTTGLLIALSTYHGWEWMGSCYGMSTLAFLQHYGVIDVLEPENGINSLSDFSNTADLISKVNYYQWSAAGSFLCENFALKKGSEIYSRQLRDLYETVSEGNIVLFTYYSGEIFRTSGHAVLLTGAYEKEDGTKVLIAYDCNYPDDYRNGDFEQRFYIDPDYTSLKREYNRYGSAYSYVGAFNWTDDYSHFEPFNIEGTGRVSVWYAHFASQLLKLVKTVSEIAFGIR